MKEAGPGRQAGVGDLIICFNLPRLAAPAAYYVLAKALLSTRFVLRGFTSGP
jgi:hypothetical protein